MNEQMSDIKPAANPSYKLIQATFITVCLGEQAMRVEWDPIAIGTRVAELCGCGLQHVVNVMALSEALSSVRAMNDKEPRLLERATEIKNREGAK